MTETKHPAEILADELAWRGANSLCCDLDPFCSAAEMLRRIPVLEAELARERASRQQAQIDLERAKEDRNRAVIETRRKVAEERAACAKECDK